MLLLAVTLLLSVPVVEAGTSDDKAASGNPMIRPGTNRTPSSAESERWTGLPSPNDVFVIAVTPHHKDLKDYFTSESLLQALPKLVRAEVRLPVGSQIFWQSGAIVLKDKTVLFWRTCGDWFIAVDRAEGTSFYAMPKNGTPKPVEGVSARLRADKTKWTANETPTLKLDVRNQGQREFYTFQAQESGRLEVDGVWYDWTGGFDLHGSWLPPGREYLDIPLSLGSNWQATQEWRDKTQAPPPQLPLKLLPGKHAIRFAPEIRDLTVKPKPQNNYVPSNPIEIEVSVETTNTPVRVTISQFSRPPQDSIIVTATNLIACLVKLFPGCEGQSADNFSSGQWPVDYIVEITFADGHSRKIYVANNRWTAGAEHYSTMAQNWDELLGSLTINFFKQTWSNMERLGQAHEPTTLTIGPWETVEGHGGDMKAQPDGAATGSQPIRAETMTGRTTAEIGVIDLTQPVRVLGYLGKPLGTRMVIDGVFAEHDIMLANPLAVTRIDGQPFKDGVSIEIRAKLQIHKGVHYRLEGYEAGAFTGYPSWQAPEAQQPFQYRSCFVVSEIIEPKSAEDGALIAPQFDPIDALARELNSHPLWPNGEAPNISLSSNATPKEVATRAVEMWGFDGGHIKTYQILEVRQIRLDAMPGCAAALIESDLGKKILLFRYEQHGKTGLWWTRFYNAPEEAESNHAANAVQP
jgi:hypothetical protein